MLGAVLHRRPWGQSKGTGPTPQFAQLKGFPLVGILQVRHTVRCRSQATNVANTACSSSQLLGINRHKQSLAMLRASAKGENVKVDILWPSAMKSTSNKHSSAGRGLTSQPGRLSRTLRNRSEQEAVTRTVSPDGISTLKLHALQNKYAALSAISLALKSYTTQ